MKGLRVLVTGASSGIGAELAAIASNSGANVVGVSRRKCDSDLFESIQLDLEEYASQDVLRKLGRFDVVIANAGRGNSCMPLMLNESEIDKMISANVKTALNTFQGTVDEMIEHRNGEYIFVGSILGRVPYAPWRCAYSASKAALAALVSGWRMELHETGISVRLFNPGLTITEFQSSANPEAIPFPPLNPRTKQFPSAIPQSPKEVATAILETVGTNIHESYSRPEIAEWMGAYYAELANGTDTIGDLLRL